MGALDHGLLPVRPGCRSHSSLTVADKFPDRTSHCTTPRHCRTCRTAHIRWEQRNYLALSVKNRPLRYCRMETNRSKDLPEAESDWADRFPKHTAVHLIRRGPQIPIPLLWAVAFQPTSHRPPRHPRKHERPGDRFAG